MHIVIDPGHCQQWTGATGRILQLKEHVVVLEIAQAMRTYFAGKGVTALLTHATAQCLNPTSKSHDLSARFNFAYSRHLPILSLHCNSAVDPRAHGYECYTLPGRDNSDNWASALLFFYKQMFPTQAMRTDMSDGDPDKETNLAVLRQRLAGGEIRNTGVLFELPFLSNPTEEKWLANKANYPQIVRALCDGTIAWLTKYT